MIENEIFKKCFPDHKKLIKYGFILSDNNYTYKKTILNDSFEITITINDNKVKGTIYDLEMEEEYTNFRIENSIGEFAGTIRDEFINLLLDIRSTCFVMQQFVSNQANRISKLIKEKYGDDPFFEWESTPDFGVFKNKDTKKWYALIMNIERKKLNAGSGKFDIVNIKLDKEKIPELLKEKGYYPAYHMNKKYWVSISLDDVLNDESIMKLIDESYSHSCGKTSNSLNEWIIPANPKYYDVVTAFKNNKILSWKQSSNIKVGDIVYIYVGAPISAILYKCLVLKHNIPYSYSDNNVKMDYVMEVELLETYDEKLYTFKKINEYGVFAVRGPRRMPRKLSNYINKKD